MGKPSVKALRKKLSGTIADHPSRTVSRAGGQVWIEPVCAILRRKAAREQQERPGIVEGETEFKAVNLVLLALILQDDYIAGIRDAKQSNSFAI
jgi:hypothetical protein